MEINKQTDNQAIKFQYNAIYVDVQAVAEIYMDTIAEDIFPFQYEKIASALDYAIKFLNDNTIALPIDMDKDIKEQIIEISKISYKLRDNSKLVKQALTEYLHEKYNLYLIKDQQIRQIIAEKKPQERQKIIDNFISDKMHDKRQELISISISGYDTTNKLIGYKEDQASQTQKQAWLNRDNYIKNHLDQKLKEWIVLEKDNYLKAVGIYSNPQQANVVIRQYQQQSSQMLHDTTKALSNDQYKMRAGKNTESTESYLLVEEGIITEREAELFNYQELNTYQAYYGENEQVIKDIFQYAREYYPESKKQGLKELAEINHEKIADIFSLLTAVRKKKISFRDIAEYSREKVEILGNNNHLLKILSPKNIFDIQAAISNNNIQTINKILVDISAKNKGQILKWAANKGYNLLVNSILEKNNNIPAKHKGIALQLAANQGDYNTVKAILKKGNNISARHNGIALQKASYNGHSDIVEILLEKRDDIPAEDKEAALEFGVAKGYFEIVRVILKNITSNISIEDKKKALEFAVVQGDYEVAKVILENVGSEISIKYKEKLVELAANKFEYDMVKGILETGNSIAVERYALEYVAYKGDYKAFIDILEEENNIYLERRGHALQASVMSNSVLIVKTILEKTDISVEDKGKSLLNAAKNSCYEIVECILMHDAQIDIDESYLLSIGSLGDNKISSQCKAEALKIAQKMRDQNMINILEKYQDSSHIRGIISTIGSWTARIMGERTNYYPDISFRL